MARNSLLITFAAVMKQKWKHMRLKSVALLLVTVIAMLTFNQSVNLHTHRLADATIVSHAHPYNKTNDSAPVKNHHHTLTGLLILNHFKIIFLSFFIAIALLRTANLVIRNTQEKLHFKLHYIHYAPGRAPPIFVPSSI
jgi:hypothetical protein